MFYSRRAINFYRHLLDDPRTPPSPFPEIICPIFPKDLGNDCLDMQLRKGCQGIGMWYIVEPTGRSLESYLIDALKEVRYNWIHFRRVAYTAYNMLYVFNSANIIHRNLSVESIVVSDTMLSDEPPRLYLLDFSVACSPGSLDDKSIGNWLVQAPEQTEVKANDCGNGLGIDVFSFGILLWECLPKPRFIRGNSLLSRLKFPCGVHPNIQNLIISCLHPISEMRPSISNIQDCLSVLRNSHAVAGAAAVVGLLGDCNCYLCNARANAPLACGHQCACEECFKFMHQCPFCAEAIVEHDREYFLVAERSVYYDLYRLDQGGTNSGYTITGDYTSAFEKGVCMILS